MIQGIEKEMVAKTTGQQMIEDKTAEYYADEEWMNGGDIPKGTGIDNSDIESITTNKTEENGNNRDRNGDESIGLTEEKLLNIKEKDKDNKEEDGYDEEEYTGNNNEINDESSNKEEEESEETDNKVENNKNGDGRGDKSMSK